MFFARVKLLTQIAGEIQFRKKLETRLHLGFSAFKDQTFNLWVQGRLQDERVVEHLSLLNMEVKEYSCYCCILVEMDFHETVDAQMNEQDIETARFAVRNIMEELLNGHGVLFEVSKERCGILEYRHSVHEEPQIMAAEIRECVLKYAKIFFNDRGRAGRELDQGCGAFLLLGSAGAGSQIFAGNVSDYERRGCASRFECM
ncbi:hypothetical protein [Paenibacillus sp. LHD-38]|uniref:hypothetical protein n=1 Tax=Paenibacillus sp. LHD-38 TaxID=3072143 RepID=UPI00280F41A5|nr:hypothetical protein [Paenibacillus sp. LHD-38]MDQ8734491.1 hypothetical protein [Paenibacillus sp. LHD-38]